MWAGIGGWACFTFLVILIIYAAATNIKPEKLQRACGKAGVQQIYGGFLQPTSDTVTVVCRNGKIVGVNK